MHWDVLIYGRYGVKSTQNHAIHTNTQIHLYIYIKVRKEVWEKKSKWHCSKHKPKAKNKTYLLRCLSTSNMITSTSNKPTELQALSMRTFISLYGKPLFFNISPGVSKKHCKRRQEKTMWLSFLGWNFKRPHKHRPSMLGYIHKAVTCGKRRYN